MIFDMDIRKIVNDSKILYVLSANSLTDDEYDEIKPSIEAIGGHWRERYKGFVFSYNPADRLQKLSSEPPVISEYRKWQDSTQYFPTPVSVVKRMLNICEINENTRILEPSAGRGAILDHIPCGHLQIIEPDPINCTYLKKKGYKVIPYSFEEAVEEGMIRPYNLVLMNPPFTRQRDIKHILLAYEGLEENGVLVSVMSENSLYYDKPLTINFRLFLKESNAEIIPLPYGSFAESSTYIDTVIIKIIKRRDVYEKVV